ncbi:hypothetical protein QTP88_008313 [Uroleucon formosanum]
MVLDFIPSHGKHTGRDISNIFHKCLVEFNLEKKVQGITVDNASANTKFMIELEKLLPDFDAENQHFRCMAHILNLGVQDLMKYLKLQTDYESEDEMDSGNEIEVDQEIDEEMESVNEIEVDQDYDEDISKDYVVQIEDSSTAIMKDKRKGLRKFEEIHEIYLSEEPVLEVPEDFIGNDEDIIDFNALYSTPVNYTNSQNSKQELEKYLSQPRSACSVDILEWEKLNQVQFPVLAKIARDFLSISATSVPAERLFSKASLVIQIPQEYVIAHCISADLKMNKGLAAEICKKYSRFSEIFSNLTINLVTQYP